MCLVFINKMETRQKEVGFFFPFKEVFIVFVKANPLFSLYQMRIFNSKEKSIDLSPTVKLLKHIGNVMFVVFKKKIKQKILNDSLSPAYSGNMKNKLKMGC